MRIKQESYEGSAINMFVERMTNEALDYVRISIVIDFILKNTNKRDRNTYRNELVEQILGNIIEDEGGLK